MTRGARTWGVQAVVVMLGTVLYVLLMWLSGLTYFLHTKLGTFGDGLVGGGSGGLSALLILYTNYRLRKQSEERDAEQ
jgi:hypothetical protein